MPTRQSVDDVADPSTLFRLDRKIALVTGAGSGIGALAAKVLARAGAAVAATDLNPDTAAATAEEIRGEGLEARPYVMDVAAEASVRSEESRVGNGCVSKFRVWGAAYP